MNRVTPEAVVFDLDGTLLNTLADLAYAMNEALRLSGMPQHPVDAYRWFVGEGMKALVHKALPRDQTHLAPECGALMESVYEKNWDRLTRPYDGIPEVLQELASRGIALTVLSNKQHDFTRKCVAAFFPNIPFREVIGVSEQNPPKPNPTGLNGILHRMKVAPKAYLYVGDTAIDMQTAASANLYSVGVSWGFRPREELQNAGACAIIDEPGQLLDHF